MLTGTQLLVLGAMNSWGLVLGRVISFPRFIFLIIICRVRDLSGLRVLKEQNGEVFGENPSPLDKDELLSSISQADRGSGC